VKIFHNKAQLGEELALLRKEQKSIGFVPTMGSLHKGHLSLIRQALEQCDIVVCSIFVNPTQFNDPKDFQLYPKHIDSDLNLLKMEGCTIVYLPEIDDIYPDGVTKQSYPLENLGDVLEGAFRPGHFDGVIEVVKRLFDSVNPDKAYFGMKDFQQLAVIKWLVAHFNLPIEIVPGPIVRDESGIALSSRNERLSPEQFQSALKLSKGLFYIQDNYTNAPFSKLKQEVIKELSSDPIIKIEYLELADTATMNVLTNTSDAKSVGVFIAAQVGEIRLIDNIVLF
jgi:pantoate--beta-alanine ligase